MKIALSDIRPNPVALRTVDRESEQYQSMRDSMSDPDIGLLNPINVQKKKDEETGKTYYELLDGLHRFTGASELGWTEIEACLKNVNGKELAAQIIANVQRIDTRPIDFTNQMKRIFAASPTMTMADMGRLVYKSPKWVEERLGLLKLHPSLQAMVNDGTIKLGNAHALSKLPENEQLNYADAAQVQDASEFAPIIEARVKQLREASRQGKNSGPPVFTPNAKLRPIKELVSEIENPKAVTAILAKENCQNIQEAFKAGLKFSLNLDALSTEAARARWDAKQKELADSKAEATAERTKKRLAEAQFNVLKSKVELGTATEDEAEAYQLQVQEREALKAQAEAAVA